MTDRDITHLDPKLQPLCQQFLDACKSEGYSVFLTQTYRSAADQDADYEQGRSLPGPIITNARAGESPHNCTLPDGTPASRAFDFAIQTTDGTLDWDASDATWVKVISIGEGLGLVSGSTFHSLKDSPHMELVNWKENI